ncbi:MAG: VWA domain-containing protein [Clostridia bacterium]|nr:VWA domain-containing protein [Clostridia bacterium]
MSFLYPLGLLALIAIPLLIIIYIIKNTYTEQVISSTYLWTLSEKFLKRKNPLRRISGLLSLILQILIVIFIAFSLAQPSFILHGSADDYLFILDGSASMNIVSGKESRLEKGKDKIESVVKSAVDGSAYTLIYVSDTTSVLCEDVTDKSRVYQLLEEIEEGYCAADLTEALEEAQLKYSQNTDLKLYLYTDKDYAGAGSNINVVNFSSGEENYAVTGVEYSVASSGLTVTGSLYSYESDASLTVSLTVDGAAACDPQTLDVKKLEACAFTFTCDNITVFTSLKVEISQADAMAADNECVVYSLKSDSTYNTLIVTGSSSSDNSFFLKSTLSAFGDVQITEMSFADYSGEGGYGLYIFDNCTPSVLPTDGAVWFINPQGSVSYTGFSVQNDVTLSSHGELTLSTSTASRVQSILSGTTWNNGTNIYITEYVKCSFSKSFYTIFSYDNNPVLFAGTNSYGNRQVVFAFDFHNTDFTLTPNYIQLMYNLFDYTFPEIVDSTSCYCGDTVEINVLAGCTSIRIDTPLGNIEYADTSADVVEYDVTETGTYTVTLMISGSERKVYFYASVPEEERYTTVTVDSDGYVYTDNGGTQLSVLGADGAAKDASSDYFVFEGTQSVSRDGTFSELWVWLLVLAVLFIADWGVYCYEQYQLR